MKTADILLEGYCIVLAGVERIEQQISEGSLTDKPEQTQGLAELKATRLAKTRRSQIRVQEIFPLCVGRKVLEKGLHLLLREPRLSLIHNGIFWTQTAMETKSTGSDITDFLLP